MTSRQRVPDHVDVLEITWRDALIGVTAAAIVITIIRRSSRGAR